MSLHVITKTTDPVSAPENVNVHWLNATTKEVWYSVGTSTVADWVNTTGLVPGDNVSELVNDAGYLVASDKFNTLEGDGGYFFTNSASDLGGSRYEMTKDIPAGGGAGISKTGAVNGDLIAEFATVSGFPNVTHIPSGPLSFYVQARQTGGTQTAKLYASFYSRTLVGVETLLGTSEVSEALTGSNALIGVNGSMDLVAGLGATDRLTVKILVEVTDAGTAPDVTIDVQGTNYSRARFPYEIDKTSIGLGNVDNTSDVDKPVSTATQTALDLKQDSISASNLQLLYQNGSGDIEGLPGYFINSIEGFQVDKTAQPDNGSFENLHNFNLVIDPLQASPNVGYNILSLGVNSDAAGFSFGTGGRAATLLNLNFSHVSDQNIGEINFFNNYFNIGNGTDVIDCNGFSYIYGFGDINASANITGAMQGYGFQPNFNASATVDSSTSYVNAFYDATDATGVTFGSYTSVNLSPQLGGIANNRNLSMININPTITEFFGNAGATCLNIVGDFGTFDTGTFNGLYLNPTITSITNANGLFIDMSNVTGTNVKAMDITGDVNINGALTFSGALSIGQLNAFYGVNPVNGAGTPTTLHGLITSMTALDSVTVANVDTIGVNTAMLITLEDNSVSTSGALGLGFTALALPCVVTTGTGSSLDNMSGSVFAINLDGASTGGTIDTVKVARSVVVPNGVTTINNCRGFEYDAPFGQIGTVNHGFYTDVDCDNYFAGGLTVGELTEVRTNSSVGIEISSETKAFLNARMTSTQRDALTPLFGMQIANSTTNKLQFYDGTSWVDLH